MQEVQEGMRGSVRGRCGDRFFNHFAAPDFSTPEWRARLMDWAVEQEWFTKFWHFCYLKLCKEQVIDVFPAWVWRNLPELVYQYDKERKGEGDE